MSIVLKDGTVLPDLPDGLVEQYPYVAIVYLHQNIGTTGEAERYNIFAAKKELAYVPTALTGGPYNVFGTNYPADYYLCQLPAPSEWTHQGVLPEGSAFVPLGLLGIQYYELVWSNHDIKTATSFDTNTAEYTLGTEIYFPSSVASAPPFILPDGTELPALPEGCFEKYPYGAVFEGTEADGVTSRYLACTIAEDVVIPKELMGTENDTLGCMANGYILYKCDPASDADWTLVAEYEDNDFAWMNLWFDLKWTNHDVFAIASYNDDGSYNTTLYHKSDVNYRIPGGWLNSMGNQARRLGGVSGAMKPGEMETVFKGVSGGTSLAPNERIYQVGTAETRLTADEIAISTSVQ